MVSRVYGGAFPRHHDIDFSQEDFQEFERRCGIELDSGSRMMIEEAVDAYVNLQSGAWRMPRPGEVRKIYSRVDKAALTLSKSFEPLTSGELASNLRYNLQRALRRNDPGSGTDLDAWLDDFLDRLKLLKTLIDTARQDLPKDKGGASDSKDWFYHLVLGLAEVYAHKTGELNVTYDPILGAYADKGFYALVAAVQSKLPDKFQLAPQSLGKTIQNILANERDQIESPHKWSSSPSLRSALLASPSAKGVKE
jgi:hypothetical protein